MKTGPKHEQINPNSPRKIISNRTEEEENRHEKLSRFSEEFTRGVIPGAAAAAIAAPFPYTLLIP